MCAKWVPKLWMLSEKSKNFWQKIRVSKIRVSKIRVSEIRGREIRGSEIRVTEIRISSNHRELHGAIFISDVLLARDTSHMYNYVTCSLQETQFWVTSDAECYWAYYRKSKEGIFLSCAEGSVQQMVKKGKMDSVSWNGFKKHSWVNLWNQLLSSVNCYKKSLYFLTSWRNTVFSTWIYSERHVSWRIVHVWGVSFKYM